MLADIAARLRGWPRRVLALGCLLLAAITALAGQRHKQPSVPGSAVLVAARDLAAGARLSPADVRVRTWPTSLRPPSAASRPAQVVGHRLAGPIRSGEPITSTRLAGSGLTVGLPAGLSAVPVEVTGAALPGLVHAGDSIDLLVGDPPEADASSPGPARILAERVRVLAVIGLSPDAGADGNGVGDGDGVGLIVAADRATALRLAAAAGRPLVATVHGPP